MQLWTGWRRGGVQNVELQSTANWTAKLQHIKSGLLGFLKSSVLVQNMFHCYWPDDWIQQVKESCKRNIKIFNKGFLSQYMLLCYSWLEIKFAILRLETLNLPAAFIFVIFNYRIWVYKHISYLISMCLYRHLEFPTVLKVVKLQNYVSNIQIMN